MLRNSLLSIFIICALSAGARLPAENVVIVSGWEDYEFIPLADGVQVRNTVKHEYEATRHSANIHPHVFYNDVIRLDKASGGKAQYKNVNSPTVFHDDSKVCFFDINLQQRGKKAKVEFKRTWSDAAYLSRILLSEEYPIRQKSVTVKIPASMPGLELVDLNFPPDKISRSEERLPDGSRNVTYSIADLRPIVDEPGAPSLLESEPTVIVTGYFPDLDSLYRWHHELGVADTSLPDIDGLLAEICGDASSDEDKIARIYRWVQRNVRYVAYEEGEAGFRPDAPAEVVRKRFGDCKGMALLLSTLINGLGIEAYPASVGMRSIPFLISEMPCLAATDHMVCVVPRLGNDMLILDATNEYAHLRHIPYSIQGKDILIDKGDEYGYHVLPILPASASVDSTGYDYAISDDVILEGRAVRKLTGDMKQYFAGIYEGISKNLQSEFLKRAVAPAEHADVNSESVAFDIDSDDGASSTLTGNLSVSDAVTVIDVACYIDLATASDPFTDKVDIDGRVHDYCLPLPSRIVRTFTLRIPDGAKVRTLPENYRSVSPNAVFSCSFGIKDGLVVVAKSIDITDPRIPVDSIARWNKELSDWKNACNQQIEIIK